MKKLTLLFCLMLTAGFLVTFSSCTTEKMDELTIEQELPESRAPTVPGVGENFTWECWAGMIIYGECANLSYDYVTASTQAECECRIDLILQHFPDDCNSRDDHEISPCIETNCNYAPLDCEG